MDLRVLGCSGGIGADLRTTSFLLGGTILVDAGTGVGELTLDEIARIRHIFLTHAHLDHIAFIPLFLDSIFDRIQTPVVVHAQPQTVSDLSAHVFNGAIWPDFTRLPHPDRPVLEFAAMRPGECCTLGDCTLEMIPVTHTVPAVGYRIESEGAALAFSGDTSSNDTFWQALNAHARLDILIVEAAFPNSQAALAQMSRHYCPRTLGEDIAKLKHDPEIYITHNKPGDEQLIFEECVEALGPARRVHRLRNGDLLQL